jgi:hypothetical protein
MNYIKGKSGQRSYKRQPTKLESRTLTDCDHRGWLRWCASGLLHQRDRCVVPGLFDRRMRLQRRTGAGPCHTAAVCSPQRAADWPTPHPSQARPGSGPCGGFSQRQRLHLPWRPCCTGLAPSRQTFQTGARNAPAVDGRVASVADDAPQDSRLEAAGGAAEAAPRPGCSSGPSADSPGRGVSSGVGLQTGHMPGGEAAAGGRGGERAAGGRGEGGGHRAVA